MAIRVRAPAESFTSSQNDKASRALVYDAAAGEELRYRAGASPARSNCGTSVIAPIRQKLRAIASESGAGKGLIR